jgi:hypothetical protein
VCECLPTLLFWWFFFLLVSLVSTTLPSLLSQFFFLRGLLAVNTVSSSTFFFPSFPASSFFECFAWFSCAFVVAAYAKLSRYLFCNSESGKYIMRSRPQTANVRLPPSSPRRPFWSRVRLQISRTTEIIRTGACKFQCVYFWLQCVCCQNPVRMLQNSSACAFCTKNYTHWKKTSRTGAYNFEKSLYAPVRIMTNWKVCKIYALVRIIFKKKKKIFFIRTSACKFLKIYTHWWKRYAPVRIRETTHRTLL